MLLIDNEVQKLTLTMAECIATQEAAFKALETGRAIHRPKTDVHVPCEREDGYYRFGSMEGAYDGIFALRFMSDIIVWQERAGDTWVEENFCIEPGTYCGLVLLFSTANGAPLAILNDGVIQHMRVGGSAALGVKYLARADSHVVAMIGSGGMAETFLEGFCEVRDIREVRVYSPTVAHRERYVAAMSERLGIEVKAVAGAREAMRGADILATCTHSGTPVFDADWLEPGMHVVAVGTQEVPREAVARFDVRIRQGTDSMRPAADSLRYRAAVGMSYAGFVGGTEEEMKRLPPPSPNHVSVEEYAHFTDLAHGRAAGRRHDDEITFYYNHGNQGLQFAAVGGVIYHNAQTRGLGMKLPSAWFLENIKS